LSEGNILKTPAAKKTMLKMLGSSIILMLLVVSSSYSQIQRGRICEAEIRLNKNQAITSLCELVPGLDIKSVEKGLYTVSVPEAYIGLLGREVQYLKMLSPKKSPVRKGVM
jgi:hypothetical protein